MSRTKVPTSRAKTAYGLLTAITRLVLAEPKRLHMGNWLMDGETAQERYKERLPACGTVGCIAGWAIMLKGTKADKEAAKHASGFVTAQPFHTAQLILGIDLPQAEALFKNSGSFFNAGTLAYARDVAARIASFQKKYAAQLKAKAV